MYESLRVDYKKFVELWMHGKDPSEIAKELNLSERQVPYLAQKLRNKGVQLPKRAKPSDIDVDDLNRLISTVQ